MRDIYGFTYYDKPEQPTISNLPEHVVVLPCPFCGNKDLWVGYNSPNRVVRCGCGVQFDSNSSTDDEVISDWNKRAT